MSFAIIVRAHFQLLFDTKVNLILLLCEIRPFVYKTFSLEVWFERLTYKVFYSHSSGFDRMQKMQNFCGKMFECQSEITQR